MRHRASHWPSIVMTLSIVWYIHGFCRSSMCYVSTRIHLAGGLPMVCVLFMHTKCYARAWIKFRNFTGNYLFMVNHNRFQLLNKVRCLSLAGSPEWLIRTIFAGDHLEYLRNYSNRASWLALHGLHTELISPNLIWQISDSFMNRHTLSINLCRFWL